MGNLRQELKERIINRFYETDWDDERKERNAEILMQHIEEFYEIKYIKPDELEDNIYLHFSIEEFDNAEYDGDRTEHFHDIFSIVSPSDTIEDFYKQYVNGTNELYIDGTFIKILY